MSEIQEYCNWSFNECLVKDKKWLVKRDCSPVITLTRGDGRHWKAYQSSLQARPQFAPPLDSSKCFSCHKYINGVNPYDDGETWRM